MSVASRTNIVHISIMNDPDRPVQFKLMIPARLKDRVSDAAELNRRSLSQEIVEALSEAYPGEMTADHLEWTLNYLITELEKTTDPDRRERIFKLMRISIKEMRRVVSGRDLRHLDDFLNSPETDKSVINPIIDPENGGGPGVRLQK